MKKLLLIYTVLLTLFTGSAFSQMLQDRNQFELSFGVFGIDDKVPTAQLQVEEQFAAKFGPFSPILGTLFTTAGDAYGYAGIAYMLPANKRFLIRPTFAVGSYFRGRGQNLGGTLEFNSGLEFNYMVENNIRLGISVHHISNAGIYTHNPGVEYFVFSYLFNF